MVVRFQILIYRDVRTNQSIKSFAELFHFSTLRKQMTDVSRARKEATEGTGASSPVLGVSFVSFSDGVPRNERSRVLGVLVAPMLSKKSG